MSEENQNGLPETLSRKEVNEAALDSLISDIDEIIPAVDLPKDNPKMNVVKPGKPVTDQKTPIKMKLKDLSLAESWNRDTLRDVDKLAQALLAEGQLVPLLVHQQKDGKMEVIDGRRRYAAMKEAGITDALVTVVNCPDDGTFERISAAANLARAEHTTMELCHIFTRLRDRGNKIKTIAQTMGFSEAKIGQYMKLEVLPEDVKKLLDSGKLDFTAAQALTRLDYDDSRDLKYFDRIMLQLQTGVLTATTIIAAIEKYTSRRAAADKAAGKVAKKKRGRKFGQKTENYDYLDTTYLKQVKPITVAKRFGEILMALQDERNNARTAVKKAFIDGKMLQAKQIAGLEPFDD